MKVIKASCVPEMWKVCKAGLYKGNRRFPEEIYVIPKSIFLIRADLL